MATDINSVTLIGRLTRDPELRMVNQTSLASFSVASNRTFNYNGEKREETLFIDCTAWGRLSEIVKQYCGKGKQVCINGRLKQSVWQDQNGQNRSKIEIVVENLQLLGGRADGPGGGGGGSYAGDYGQSDYGQGNPMNPGPGSSSQGGNSTDQFPGAAEFDDSDMPF